jgi:hypothetical protein
MTLRQGYEPFQASCPAFMWPGSGGQADRKRQQRLLVDLPRRSPVIGNLEGYRAIHKGRSGIKASILPDHCWLVTRVHGADDHSPARFTLDRAAVRKAVEAGDVPALG